MTTDHEIERVLDRWLSEGPTQPATGFLDDTMDRIARAPRRHLASPRTRLPIRNFNVRLATIAAAIVIAVSVGFVVLRLPSAGTAVPTEAVTPLVDSSMLIAKWSSVGDRTFPKMPTDALAALRIDATTLSMNGWKGPIDSSWSLTPDRHLVVTMQTTQANLTMQHFDCRPGQEGSYTVGLSADGLTMFLTPIRDDCLARAGIMTGAWTRWPCPNPDSVCAPELTPGVHHSSFAPNGDPNALPSSPPALTGYSFTVPAGWSSSQNALARPNDPAAMAIRLAPYVAPRLQAECPDDVEPGVGSSPTDIATWLQGLPGLVTTTPTPVTIGGHKGLQMDVSVAPAWRQPCQQYFGDAPARVVFPFRDPVDLLEGNAHARYILLELGAAHTLLIEITGPDEASWNDLVQAAMPIVETFEFTR